MFRRTATAGLAVALATMGSAAVGSISATGTAAERSTYLVRLADSVADPGAVASEKARAHGGSAGYVYRHALKGFSITMPDRAAEALRADPRVISVEHDQQMSITAQTIPTGIERIFADENPNLMINGVDDYRPDVDIAVLDTGIDFDHPDLDVVARTNCVNSSSCTDNSGDDGHGHGTHVAGTAGAIDNTIGVVGVAPGARLWAVKVLADSGSGSLTGVTAGIDWVTARADQIEVINMSLGCSGCSSSAMSAAISNAVDAGIVVAVAAGNDDQNAANFFPANHPDVITVSALADFDGEPGGNGSPTCRTDQDDTLADFSNWGATIEVTAPGTCIYSTWNGGGYNTISGTSMASPHVAGAAGLLAEGTNKPTGRADVEAIRAKIIATGNFDWTDDSGDGIKEPLLDVGDPAEYPGSPPAPGQPVASFTASCSDTDTTCTFDGSASSDPDGSITSWGWDFGDGTTGTGEVVTHTYAEAGTYTVTLTVTDNDGNTDTASTTVEVGPPPANEPPTASFTASCNAFPSINFRYCIFNGSASSDPDGSIESWAWNFGDGSTGSGEQVYHRYVRAGTYTVTLTVTDNQGATDTESKSVVVP